MIEFNAAISAWFLCSFGPHSSALVVYLLERYGIPLNDAVELNCKKRVTTENQGTGAWYMG